MIVLINGSFGVGKSTVARRLKHLVDGSRIFDPELTGTAIRLTAKIIPFRGRGTDDYQDISLWRRSVVGGVRLFRTFTAGMIIVPMTFTNKTYLDEIMIGITRYDPDVRQFCLTADLAVVRQRLQKRGSPTDAAGKEWIDRRILECNDAHRQPGFGEVIKTDELTADQVAELLKGRIITSNTLA
jgi:broad-specificity NMP kinase